MIYSREVLHHFTSPSNVYKMEDADAVGTKGDPDCGDALEMFIKVKENRIEEISYLVYGCCAAIATSSMTTELAKGKTLEEAFAITEEDIANALGGLPDNKMHCSNLGVSALREAIMNYRRKQR
ncbi:iron-sulfur cluster assembly scaffold protein [Acidaminobacter hydrogenoformans]|uniref:Nitrogen fixation protein NifU n=1 Tax=Acidaminobacter hydrogenoformans DSM 2784 TaxID=1120920 RepID=A0A1G5S1F8_9FIRM|nr:iron-sulfur cluster assembly scaffold protein [Acidaminobacter hydrogenoformans]SCZ80126.1 nitrogen fixation protein NifU [Acidaminobacter hydrogenoformans DSM 2784]